MEMGGQRRRHEHGYYLPKFDERPKDFEEVFVKIGRIACEEHYEVGRREITKWLEESGRDRLTRMRAEHAAKHGNFGAVGAAVRLLGRERVNSLRAETKLTPKEMGEVLKQAFPVHPRSTVSFTEARRAAQYLRDIRNGGWIVSPAGDGSWWIGSRRRTAAELVEMAEAKGFGLNLTRDGDGGVG